MTVGRRPLDAGRLVDQVDRAFFGDVTVVEEIGSTNVELVATARAGADRGVLTAEYQSAGRGRLDRVWTAPARSGLAVSVLLTPPVAGRRWSWLPLVTGLALLDAVRSIDLPATATLGLKWPNDLLVDGTKAAGILAERVDDRRVVIGLGLNVSLTEAELPVPTATSLELAGAGDVDRTALLVAYLDALATQCRRWWTEPDDEDVRSRYLAAGATVGRRVSVQLPDGRTVEGLAIDVDAGGALVVDAGGELPLVVAAGDVRHVREASRLRVGRTRPSG